ncbi:MAG TPA: L,D-transpeptidase, partial [Pararhizobium sp.]|nr:L,D-transpeptidase [Pararhizobium sp.]
PVEKQILGVSKMRIRVLLSIVVLAVVAALTAAAGASAQEIVGYGPDGPIVLVSPDGRMLNRAPEYGSVEEYFTPQGDRVLVDHWGRLVAREVPLYRARSYERRNPYPDIVRVPPGHDYSVQRLDLPPPADEGYDGNDYSSLDTGTIPIIPAPSPSSLPQQEPQDILPSVSSGGNYGNLPRAEVAKLQILLDREGASPGVIDGRMGDNVRKALDAYAAMSGKLLKPSDAKFIHDKLMATGGPAFQKYTITPSDAAGPYVASIPSDYAQKAQLTRMSYTSTAEMLAERFHMDEDYMKMINPGIDFSVPGTVIKVADPGAAKHAQATLIIVDKTREQVRAYGSDGQLLTAYPATIGSTDLPSPSGTVTVARIAPNPEYTYNPKINFKQGDNNKVLTVPPGPNGPVGNMWIALSKPTYGIHGTSAPSQIGKSNSHGCVRLTNWDAHELAKMIKPGVTVKFVGHSGT